MGPSATTRRSSGARAVALMLGQWLVLGGCWEPVVREVFEPGGGWSGPVGDMGEACVPADDDVPSFSGFAVGEVNISTEDGRCSSGTCLVHHFQGRVSCPEGNLDEGDCFTPSGALVSVAVQPQLAERPADLTVHCSCRCDGPPQFGPFCTCSPGMACTDLGFSGSDEVDRGQGSYCTWL